MVATSDYKIKLLNVGGQSDACLLGGEGGLTSFSNTNGDVRKSRCFCSGRFMLFTFKVIPGVWNRFDILKKPLKK